MGHSPCEQNSFIIILHVALYVEYKALHPLCIITFGRKNLLSVSLADFAFEDSGSLAAFGSSFGRGFVGLAADSPLISSFGGSGGGGGGTDIPLGAAGGSDICATWKIY